MNNKYKQQMAGDVVGVRVLSQYRPHVHAGDALTVEVEHVAGDVIKADDVQQVHFTVSGPHERLAETEIVGRYPAPGTDSSPDEFLPHIALTRRTLPWERLRDKTKPNDSTPWVALLLFKTSEVSKLPVATKVKSLDLPATKAFYTRLKGVGYRDDSQLDIMWVADDTLTRVLPLKSELPLLCHVQRLDLPPPDASDTELDPMWKLDDDATVAIVMSNRLPDATGTADPEEHIACLVSLECVDDAHYPTAGKRKDYVMPATVISPVLIDVAHERVPATVVTATTGVTGTTITDALHPAPTVAPHAAAVTGPAIASHVGAGIAAGVVAHPVTGVGPAVSGRVPPGLGTLLVKTSPLVVLHSWKFTPSKAGDFEQVIKAIRYTPNGGVLRFGQRPVTVSEPSITTLTADGYLIVDNPAEPSKQAYYRGPLTPNEVGRQTGIAVRAAPAELQDPAHPEALDDYSYAAAFEIGHLLTLADDGLLSDLQQVRRTLQPPVIKEVLAVDPRPAAIAKKDWVVNPNPEESVILPAAVADFTGVAEYRAQLDMPALLADLRGAAGGGVIDQVIDIGAIDVAELDAQFASLVTFAQSVAGRSQP